MEIQWDIVIIKGNQTSFGSDSGLCEVRVLPIIILLRSRNPLNPQQMALKVVLLFVSLPKISIQAANKTVVYQ